ncbi:MAG: hypothetical protein ACR2KE_02830 [Candidatus Nanopelagicales bacterium]
MAGRNQSGSGYVDLGLTDDEVDVIVENTVDAAVAGKGTWHRGRPGRPSLNGRPEPSPHVGFRVTPELRSQAEGLARRQGISLSEFARKALESYVHEAATRA